MKTRYVYFAVAGIAVLAVIYPILYAQFSNSTSNNLNPFACPPLLPCQKPAPASFTCHTTCYVYMQDSSFNPQTINATIGSTIVWVNQDYVAHTTTAFNTSLWDSGIIAAGHSWSLKITNSYDVGTEYFYHCNVHAQMVGLVVIVPS